MNSTQILPKLETFLQIIKESFRGFLRHHGWMRTSALTYTTLFGVVPFLILLSAVASQLGYLDLVNQLVPVINKNLFLDLPLDKIEVVINHAEDVQLPSLGFIGFFALLVSFVIAMSSLENNLNVIWKVKRNRTAGRRLAIYLPFLLFSLLLVVILSVMLFKLRILLNELFTTDSLSPFHDLLRPGAIISFFSVFFWVVLLILYTLVPVAKVQFKASIISSTISICMIWTLLLLAIKLQHILFTRLSILYGSVAVFPLILLAVYAIWMIILYGNCLTYNIQRYFEGTFYDRRLNPDRRN
jgi:membrane protein